MATDFASVLRGRQFRMDWLWNSGYPLSVNTLMRIDLHCGNAPD